MHSGVSPENERAPSRRVGGARFAPAHAELMRPRFLLLVAISALSPVLAVASPGVAQAPGDALVEAPTSNRAALFDDELALLEGAVVSWLAARDDLAVRVLPSGTRTSLEAPTCAAPMSSHDVIRERLGRVARVFIHADCVGEPPCELSVDISRPPVSDGPYDRLHAWRAPVPSGAGQIARFIAAVSALAEPPPAAPGGILGTLGRAEREHAVRVDWVSTAGHFRDAPTPESIARLHQPALDACHADGWSSASTEHAVLSFARDGAVARCEINVRHEPVDDERAACLCGALSALRVARGAPDRRIELGLLNTPRSGVLAGAVTHHARFDISGTTGGFRAYPGFSQVHDGVARCYAMAGITTLARVGLRVVVSETGVMTRAELDGTHLTPEIGRCLSGVLTPMTFTCPMSGAEASWSGSIVAYTEPND